MKFKIYFIVLLYLGLLFPVMISAEVIWENFYNPFGADGINVRSQMQVCSDGGFAVTGYYVIEDPYGGYIDWCGYVMKISSEGELQWADPDTVSFATAPTHESDVVIETSDGGFINGGDGYMIKRDSEGNRVWEQDLNYAPITMCHSPEENIIVTGGTPDEYTLFRIIDEDGNEILNNDFIVGNSTSIRRVIPTSDGGYAMTGTITQEEGYRSDIIIIKTNATGDTLWTYRKDGDGYSDRGNWIIENSQNDLLICGELIFSDWVLCGYVGLFEPDGQIIWEKDSNEEVTGLQQFYAIDLPEDNSFLITAGLNGLDIYKCDYDYNIEWIDNDMLFMKPWYQRLSESEFIFYFSGAQMMKWEGELVDIEPELIIFQIPELNCYPNPFNPEVTISFKASEYNDNAVINIYNTKGQRVRKLKIENAEEGTRNSEPGIRNVIWDGCDDTGKRMSSGVYFVTLYVDGKTKDFQKITLLK